MIYFGIIYKFAIFQEPDSELYKQIIQNQPVVLLERIHVEQPKSDSTSDGMKKAKRAIEKSTSETNQDENEQRSKRKRCSHCVEIAVLKQLNEQLLRQANELQVQLNYLSTIVEEVVEQQVQLVKKHLELSLQFYHYSLILSKLR